MSTAYNNQWMLERPRQERRERDASHEARQPRTSHDRGRGAQGRGAHEGVRSAFYRPVRKRPRWIDRDT